MSIQVPNIIGNGMIYAQILNDGRTIDTPPSNLVISTPGAMMIGFYTPTSLYIDSITIQSSTKIDVSLDVKKRGGLQAFSLKVPRNINIKFFNQMFVQFHINQNHWYTGIVDYNLLNDSNDNEIILQGNGFVKQLKKQIINITYANKTVQYIIDDIFKIQIVDKTDIYYNIIFNLPPDITLVSYEANDRDVQSVIEDLLDICNISFDTIEYSYWIDKDRFFHFELLDKTNIQKNFFEGVDYQNPKVSINSDKILNSINLYITNANSQTVVYDSNIQDADSILNYGEKKEKLTLPINMDTATGQRIAQYKINRWKSPKKTIAINNLKTEFNPFVFGTYNITNKQQPYNFLVDECNDLSKWVFSLSGGTVTIETNIVNSGRASFKWVRTTVPQEYIEFVLDDPIFFWETITVYIMPISINSSFCVQPIDINGDFPSGTDFAYLITEDGRQLLTESGDRLITEYTLIKTFNNLLHGTFQPLVVNNLTGMKSLKKIRIYNYNVNSTCYVDRLEVGGRLYSTSKLTLESIKYKTISSVIMASAEFGEIDENAVDKIKQIDEKQANIFNIFTKH